MQEKQIQLAGLNINYKVIGESGTPIVLLHGWGISSDRYIATAEKILEKDKNYIFFIPDLPGFGKSDEPGTDWTLDDYVEFTKAFVDAVALRDGGFEPIKDILKEKLRREEASITPTNRKILMLAHSFGGRIAIKYAVKYPDDLELLVLTGAAGIRHVKTNRRKVLYVLSKAGKTILSLPLINVLEKSSKTLLYRIAGVNDYRDASSRMKGVMKNVIGEDLSKLLDKIDVPTFLIWGRNDNSTPLIDGEIMHANIRGSKLDVIENANHSVPYNNAEEFAKIFLQNVKKKI
jgi:pimeloyl-ACP methyl ester carboxylesterase